MLPIYTLEMSTGDDITNLFETQLSLEISIALMTFEVFITVVLYRHLRQYFTLSEQKERKNTYLRTCLPSTKDLRAVVGSAWEMVFVVGVLFVIM